MTGCGWVVVSEPGAALESYEVIRLELRDGPSGFST